MNIKFASLVTCVYLFTSGQSAAQTVRDLDDHEHGSSIINLVIDHDKLFLEFESPWMSLIGFEHAPSNDEQHAQLNDALAILNQPESLFSINDKAGCAIDSVEVSDTLSEHADETHTEHDEHKDEEHAEHDEHDEHDDEEHDEHKDKEHAGHEHETGTVHSEVFAQYTYVCDRPDELESVALMLFDQWPLIDKVRVQLAGPSGQDAVELEADTSSIGLTQIK